VREYENPEKILFALPGFLRKMARRTEPDLLQHWFNRDVVGIFKQHHAFDAEGIFIGDATYLFVPNNPNYENSSLMLFDEHNHPVDASKLTVKERARCTWKRCYKLVSLIHTNWSAEFFLYAGLVVTAGQDHEAPLLYRLVEAFVEHHGRGVMMRLILDRGFLDGAQIGRCKQESGIHVLIPARQNMDIYQDVLGLAEAEELFFQRWIPPVSSSKPIPLHCPPSIQKREEARQRTLARKKAQTPPLDSPDPSKMRVRSEIATVSRVETFSSCPIPLDVLVNRETYADGHTDYWVLLDVVSLTDGS
jgi:hypothetical protein